MILRDMTEADLDAVLRLENEAHTHPWTIGNFGDALRSRYQCKVHEAGGIMLGYAVMMLGVDEAELLDIVIARCRQRHGLGRMLLEEMMMLARRADMRRMVLEVRTSNAAAIGLYRRAGFAAIGLRHDYYPAGNGRENAIVMGRDL